jgi:hypothetical protein
MQSFSTFELAYQSGDAFLTTRRGSARESRTSTIRASRVTTTELDRPIIYSKTPNGSQIDLCSGRPNSIEILFFVAMPRAALQK